MGYRQNAQQNAGNFNVTIAVLTEALNPPWTTNGNSTTTGSDQLSGVQGCHCGATAGRNFRRTHGREPGVPNPYAAGTFMWTEGLPEPSSFVLAATGALSLLGVYGWKKKTKAFAVVRKQ